MKSGIGVFLLLALSASAQTIIEPRIVSETLPAGGEMQIKMDLTSPHPITTSGADFGYDSGFDSIDGVALRSPAGDAYGVAVAQGGRIKVTMSSPLATLGTTLDYPFLMVAARIRAGLAVGTAIPINFGPTSIFFGPDGLYSLPAPKNGVLTIGGSVAISNVVPGGGVLPAGTLVRIFGTGFSADTKIVSKDSNVTNIQYVSPTEFNATMLATAELTGTMFNAKNKDKSESNYYAYLRAVAVGSSSKALLNNCHPLYQTAPVTSAGVAVSGTATAFALKNTNQIASDIQLELVSSAGASLGKVNINIPSGGQYMRTVQELFGQAPAGSSMKIATAVAIQALGITLDEPNTAAAAFLTGAAPTVITSSLSAAPSTLSFNAVAGAAAPAAQSVAISSSGAAASYTVASNAAWLTAAPASGTTPGSMNVSVNTTGLAAGTYPGTLTISGTGVNPATVSVTLNVAPASQFSFGPASFTFDAVAGGAAPASKPLSLATTGAALAYTAASSQPWLTFTSPTGTTPATLNVSANPTGLAVGVYSGSITITNPGANTATIGVTLNVTAAPVLGLAPATLTFNSVIGGATPASQSVAATSSGAVLPYSTSTSAAWLNVLPANGSTPGTLTVSVNPTGLAAGAYSGTVTVTPTGAAVQTVAVTLNVAAAPQLVPAPTSLTFTGLTPLPQTLNVSSTSTPLNFSATSNAAWLTVTPSGTTPAALSVSVNSTGLAPGTYNGVLTLTPPAGSTVQTVGVTFTVTAAPQLAATPTALAFSAAGSQTVAVTSTGTPLAVSPVSNAAWLTVSSSSGTTPSTLTITASSTGLIAGTYNGAITLSPSLSIPVSLTVPVNQLTATPATLTFNAAGSQSVAVTSTAGPLAVTPVSNAAWLTASASSGTTPSTLTVTASPTGLTGGVYNGTITLAPGVVVSVTLNVPQLSATPNSLTFNGTGSQTVAVTSTVAPVAFTPVSNAFWLTAVASSGTTPSTLTVTAAFPGPAPGPLTGTITLAPGVTISVILNNPQLSAAPTALTFNGNGSQTVAVTSTFAPLAVTPVSNAPWLTVVASSATTPSTLTLTANTTGLSIGLPFTATIALSPTVFINVTLNVPVPVLTAAPSTLTFNAAGSQTVNVTSGDSALAVTAVSSAAWLTASASSGTTPSVLTVTANPTGLAGGVYTGTITLAPGVVVAVTLNVPLLSATPAALTFNGAGSQTVAVTSTVSPLAVTPVSSAAWLTAVPSSGTTPSTLTVTANTTGLAPGPYSGTITLSPTVSIAVTLNVAQLVATPSTLTFTGNGTQAVAVTSTSFALPFTATSSAAWLTAAPSSGTTPATLNVTANTAGLAPGPYSGSITLAPGVTIAVSLTVPVPVLAATPTVLTFNGAGTQAVAVTSTGAALPVTPVSSAAWLTTVASAGTTPATLNVTANPAGLAPGTYTGTITLSGSLSISVTLNVPVPQLVLSPAALSFDGSGSRALSVASTGNALTYTAASSAPWLSVAPASGATPASLAVTVLAGGLAPGTYSGTLTFTAPGATTQTVAVSLNIAAAPVAGQLSVSPGSLTFDGAGTQSISVASTGSLLGFVATTNVPWLTAAASSGQTPASVSVVANPAGLAAGAYAGVVTLTAGGAATQTVSVTMNVTAAAPEVAAIANGASQAAGTSFAPGQILTIYGKGVGPATGVFGSLTGNRFDTSAGGTRVFFGAIPAPVLFASAGQVNVIVPYEAVGTTTVTVEFEGRRSTARDVQVVLSAPALFTQDSSGRGRSAILNQDYSLNTPARPAARGAAVMLYATGGGQTTPASATGQIAGSDLRPLALPVSVLIGGRPATVLYAGAAPGLVTGLTQINVLIPADVTAGDAVPITINIGGASSPAGTTLSIN